MNSRASLLMSSATPAERSLQVTARAQLPLLLLLSLHRLRRIHEHDLHFEI
jgi:hypothetical protein